MTARKHDRPAVAKCYHCEKLYQPLSYKNRFCSSACATAHGNGVKKLDCGPCPTCLQMFKSRDKSRIYCSQRCYVGSETFRNLLAENRKKIDPRTGTPRVCHGCQKEYPRKKVSKYCSNVCRRKYYAERFDRWVANPEQVALPQNYDEFLSRDVLSCPIDGCEWEGLNLGYHVNLTHGITAREFKKLCGFNLTTGLVGESLSEWMSAKATRMVEEGVFFPNGEQNPHRFKTGESPGTREYVSLESKEHGLKARAEIAPLKDVFLQCRQCGVDVQQPTFGQRFYCSTSCRSLYYGLQGMAELTCTYCGAKFDGRKDQQKRAAEGKPVCCSLDCRNKMNMVRCLAVRGIEWPKKPGTDTDHAVV